MRSYRFIRALMYLLVSLALMLTSCGGEGGGIPSRSRSIGQFRQVSGASGRTVMLRSIRITPDNPLGINAGTQTQFTATGSYSDNSVQDLTTMVVWTSSDISITTVSNTPDAMGLATAVSKGYCSISATFGNISGSTVMGVQ